jgi:tetratricopeptide (TPR) repeat protein
MLLVCAVMAASPACVAQPAQIVRPPAAVRAEAYYLFLQARRLEGEGEIDGALAAHRRALELAPDAAEIHAELAGLFARQNRVDEAVASGQAALALDPDNREANRILGFVFAARVDGRPGVAETPESLESARKAIAHFEKARAGRAADPGAELTLGRLYVIAGEYDRGITVLRDFLLDQPGYVEAILLLADAQQGKGDTDGAIATLQQVIDGQPGNARAAMRLAELFEARGRWADAASVYERLMTTSPRMAPALRPRRATALVNAGRLDEARAILRELTAESPGEAGIWYLAAQAALRAGSLDEAEEAARRIVALDAADPRGPSALADVLVARGEPARALDQLEPWLDRSAAGGLTADAEQMLLPRAAQVFAALDRADRAVDVLERLARRVPDDADVKFELAAAYEQANRHADAERLFREIVQADPVHALALNYLGYMLADRGERLDEAVSLISRALAIEPGNPSYADSLGWAYFKQGRFDLAAEHLGKAAEGAATSSVIQDHYGDALFALKRYADAIDAWQRALAGDRSDIDPEEIEKKIARTRGMGR